MEKTDRIKLVSRLQFDDWRRAREQTGRIEVVIVYSLYKLETGFSKFDLAI